MICLPPRLTCLVLLLSILLPVSAAAVEVSGLYAAVVAVSSQAASERQSAVEEGFRQVLVKISGQRGVLANPVLQAEVANAGALLNAYRYEAAPTAQNSQQTDGSTGISALRLRMSFDVKGVMAVVSRAGVPVWASTRPPVYLWVGRTTPTGRQIFGPDTPQGVTLIDAAGVRGLPVILTAAPQPAGDEAGAVAPEVVDAAARAGARVILSAATGTSGSGWRAAGVLSVDGIASPVAVTAADEYAVLRELVAVIADRLGARYAVAVRSDSLRSIRLRVAGVADLQGHAQLLRWLQDLPLVRDVVTELIRSNEVQYLLNVAGEPGELHNLLAADGRLGDVVVNAEGVPVLDARLLSTSDR